MRNDLRYVLSLVLPISLWLAACGASSPPAATPSEPATAASASAAAGGENASAPPPAASGAAAEPAKGVEGQATAPPAAPPPTNKRTPRDVLELKDTVFFLAFDESDPKKGADAACSKSAGKNRAKLSACLAKARQAIDAEGHRFEQDKAGDMWWLIVRLKGNAIVTTHKVRFTFGAQTDSTIFIVPEGKDL